MATDKLINQTQGADIIDALSDIATNVGNITYGPQTSADKVVSMLGYAEAAEAASINPGDTLNVAIGKLEKKANDNATAVAGKIDKLTNATAGDIATVTATGEIADSTVSIADSNTGLADSDTAVPTSKTVKTYVDSTATGISRYLGTITAANQLSTSAKKGDFYVVKTAWTGVHAGDEIIAEKNGPAQTIDGTNWSLLHNEADTDTKYQFGEGTTNGTFLVTPSDTGTAQPVAIKGLGNAAYKGVADTVSTSTDLVTSKAVNTKLASYVPNSDFVADKQNLALLEQMNGAKNKINFTLDWYKRSDLYNSEGTWSGNVYTVANVGTVTINSDSTLTFKKTSSNTRLIFRIVPMSEGLNYIGNWMFGCPEGGGDNTYRMVCEQASSPYGNRGIDGGSGSVIGDSTISIYIYIVLDPSYTTPTEGIIFKPMIISAEAKNAGFTEYMPYTLPNTAITPELIELCDSGAKNLLNTPTVTVSNITWAVDSNSYITASPNNSDPRYYEYSNRQYTVHLKPGSYVLVLDIKTSTSNNYANLVLLSTSDTVVVTITNAEIKGKTGMVYSEFTITTEGDYGLIAKVYDLVSRIMICTKAAFGVSSKFVPYRPNWDLVGMLVPKTMYKTVNFSAANTWTYSDLSFTVPAGSIYLFIASMSWNSGKPTGICITNTSTVSEITASTTLAVNELANNGITCIYQMPADMNVDRTLYVCVKNEAATGSSPVRFTAIRIV